VVDGEDCKWLQIFFLNHEEHEDHEETPREISLESSWSTLGCGLSQGMAALCPLMRELNDYLNTVE
jgi:hypothetical protein